MPQIRIERIRVSLTDKLWALLPKFRNYPNGWPILCAYSAILGITSFALVVYLKIMGELTPFCLYDNWYYLVYYLFLSVFACLLIPLANIDVFPLDSPFWRWSRRLGVYVLMLELEAFFHVLFYFRDIYYEIEYDDEAQVVVLSMVIIGIIRLVTITVAYMTAGIYLRLLQQRYGLSAHHFGNFFTDLADFNAIQLIVYSLSYFPFNVYNIGFVSSVAFLYISFRQILVKH